MDNSIPWKIADAETGDTHAVPNKLVVQKVAKVIIFDQIMLLLIITPRPPWF